MFTDTELMLQEIYQETPNMDEITSANLTNEPIFEEINKYLNNVVEFSEKRIKPGVLKRAKEGVGFDGENIILPSGAEEIYSGLNSLGLTNIIVPKDTFGIEGYSGGWGQTYALHSACVELVSRIDPVYGVSLSINASGIEAIDKHATEEAKKECFPRLVGGEWAGIALTEPGKPGSDLKLIETRAVLENGEYSVTGQKQFITDAGRAKYHILMARTDSLPNDAPRDKREFTAFILDRDSPGVSIGKPEDKFGLQASPTASIYLDKCKIPESYRLGEEGKGIEIAKKTLGGGRITICAQAIGIAVAALREAVEYAEDENRKPFGKTIAELPSTKNRFELIENYIAKGRWLYLDAANRKDRGDPDWPMYASKAKLFGTECSERATRLAAKTFGGNAFIKEYNIGWHRMNSWPTTIYEGTSDVNELVIKSYQKKANSKDQP